MSEPGFPSDLLAVAVDAARRALRRLDDEEVPARLRRVAASSARRLPPPLERQLIAEMDASDWLRARAAEECGPVGESGGDPRRLAASLFLERPDGWEDRLASIGAGADGRTKQARIEDLERRLRRALGTVQRLELELAEARAETERAVRASVEMLEAERDRLLETVGGLRRSVARLEAASAGSTVRETELAAALAEADDRIAELRVRVGRLVQRSSNRSSDQREQIMFGRASPLDMGRTLDQLMEAYRVAQDSALTQVPDPPLRFPSDRRPDTREAVDWLLSQSRALTVIIDGYNVAFGMSGDSAGIKRRRVALAAGRIRRLADAPLVVVVFWDSAAGEDDDVDSGVEVRYVGSADDAIVDRVEGLEGRAVVVTSDRELRERVEALGAIALWSAALHDWLGG